MRLKILVLPGLESVVRMQQGEVMSPKIELEAVANKAEKIDDWVDWSGLYHQGIAEMMAKGTYAKLLLATNDLDGVFARLRKREVEVVEEPALQPYGVRDCAFRDPAGNLIRLQEVKAR